MVPCSIKTAKSHIEVKLTPEIVSESWENIESSANLVLQECEKRKQPVCLIDLSALNYMGSSIVAMLVRVWKGVRKTNGNMVVVVVHPVVRETITLAGLDKIWTLYPHVNAAYLAIGAPLPADSSTAQGRRGKKVLVGAVLLAVVVLAISAFMRNQ